MNSAYYSYVLLYVCEQVKDLSVTELLNLSEAESSSTDLSLALQKLTALLKPPPSPPQKSTLLPSDPLVVRLTSQPSNKALAAAEDAAGIAEDEVRAEKRWRRSYQQLTSFDSNITQQCS